MQTNAQIGSTIALNGYRLVETLYEGSKTVVCRGVRLADNLPVAVKIPQQDYPTFNELLQFRNQYAIAKNLNISGIIRPYSLESYRNGYALVMEDFGGISLRDYAAQNPLSMTSILEIALQGTDILHDLHANCVIHKDIKPANILIHPLTHQVKLIDFSISSLLPKETQEIKNANVLEGTLAYISPEQTGRMNRGIDYRTDFYSFGVTLYELLAGQLPFECAEPMELVHCHIAKQPAPLSDLAKIPPVLEEIVFKLMAKNAESRYQSALGLKFDLEKCWSQLKDTGRIDCFKIATRDVCNRFIIPEQLYGRQAEVQTLLEAFERVATPPGEGGQGVELMLVAGFSGVGKTAVINEVHKPIVRQRGYFIKGKFDQFNRDIPLFGFVRALRDLMEQLLSESDVQLARWRSEILTAVGDNGQVLIDVIPELEGIIGKQPPVPELSGSAAQNRFNLLFQKFIEVFATAEHPLVLFLDDLQWVDPASLQLIKLLMKESAYLLMLGAYRDNEVSPVHPFAIAIEELKQSKAVVKTITLTPLDFEDTNYLIADTLNCTLELARPLTELVDRKTRGNPFFTTQFLKALYEEGYIRFDLEVGHWECDLARIKVFASADDVVEFMAGQLQKFPPETQHILKLAACIGNSFSLETLAIVSEQLPAKVATFLWKALQEGLILPTSQIYKFFQGTDQPPTEDTLNPTYRFLHDRVQQAAYSLIPEDQKQQTHLAIARLLQQNIPDSKLEANIFEIVNHWNGAIDRICDLDEKNTLARLNFIAGRKAKASLACEPALKYYNKGLNLLGEQGWKTQFDLMLELQESAAEAAFLCGEFWQMEQHLTAIFARQLPPIHYIKALEIQIQAYTSQCRFQEAIDIARTALKQFNTDIPERTTFADVRAALQEVTEVLDGRTASDLLDLPVMSEPESLATLQLLASVTATAYVCEPLLFSFVVLVQVKLSIQKGNSPISAFVYSCYGILLSSIVEDLEGAYDFGQLGLKLVNKFNAQSIRPKVNIALAAFTMHGKLHCRDCMPFYKEAFQVGLEVGDLEFVGYSTMHLCQYVYLTGKNLISAVTETEPYVATLQKLNIMTGYNYSQAVLQTIERLQGEENPSEAAARSQQLYTTLKTNNDLNGLHYYWVYKLTGSYLLARIEEANKEAAEARQTLAGGASMIGEFIFYFYDSLTALALYDEATDKTELLERVATNQKKLQHRARHAPMNFQHKYDLVEAERCRVLGRKIEAIELYDRAIAGAKQNAYLNEEALANELAAKFYLNWQRKKIAATYLQDAYYAYAKWGAKAKTEDLEKYYPQLLHPSLHKANSALTILETLTTLSATTYSRHSTSSQSASSTSLNNTLDFATLLKVSQSWGGDMRVKM